MIQMFDHIGNYMGNKCAHNEVVELTSDEIHEVCESIKIPDVIGISIPLNYVKLSMCTKCKKLLPKTPLTYTDMKSVSAVILMYINYIINFWNTRDNPPDITYLHEFKGLVTNFVHLYHHTLMTLMCEQKKKSETTKKISDTSK